jgi:lactose/L-arabinose transport system substrate-binding protein
VRSTIVVKAISDYLNGTFKTAKEALDSAAQQISDATGVPLAS